MSFFHILMEYLWWSSIFPLISTICHLFTYINMHENKSFFNLHAIIGMCYHHQNISKKDSFSAVIFTVKRKSKQKFDRRQWGLVTFPHFILPNFLFPISWSFHKRGISQPFYLHYISDNIPPLDCVIDPLRNYSLSNKSHLLSKGQRSLSNFVNYLIIHLFKHEFVQVFPDTAVFDWYITLAEKYK